MRKGFNKYTYLAVAVCCFIAAIVVENGLLHGNPETILIRQFQKKLNEAETTLGQYIDEIAKTTEKPGFGDYYLSELSHLSPLFEEEGMGFLIYRDDKLFFWSDRSVAFRDMLPLSDEDSLSLVQFPNGHYLVQSKMVEHYTILGLLLIKHRYPHENKFLVNRFFKNFHLPNSFILLQPNENSGYPVYNLQGQVALRITPGGELYCSPIQLYLPALLYLAALFFLLVYILVATSEMNWGIGVRWLFISSVLFLLYWLHILFRVPSVFFHLGFFSPSHFALSYWIPSLGDFFIVSLFFFYLMLIASRDLNLSHIEKNSGIQKKYISVALISITAAAYLVVNYFITLLIKNSSFSFTLNQINEITFPTIFGIASIMLLLFGLVSFSIRVTDQSLRFMAPRRLIVITILVSILLLAFQHLFNGTPSWRTMLFFVLIVVFSVIFKGEPSRKFSITYIVAFISLLTVYSLEVIYRVTVQKERQVQRLMAVNLVAEHDPAAEVFLAEIQEQISVDPNIPKYLIPPFENIEEYIERTYFSGFFRQYDLQITVCTGSDSLLIQPQNITEPCFPFFDKMISSQGYQLPGTSFYYMDNMNGRISYFGKLHYPLSADSIGVSIFLELNSKIQSEGIGFPELLIDKSMRKPISYKRFDYAKYYGGELVDRHGNYLYNYYIFSYNFGNEEFSFNTWDGYEHLFYCTREDNYVIVSRSLYTFVDYLISFPYLFVFYLLFSLLLLFLLQPSFRLRRLQFDLKLRIQAAIISIVFVSLLLVALSTILYNIEEYRIRLKDDLNGKMSSISVEIDHQLTGLDRITPEVEGWLARELVRLSNVFRTDINIYGVNGDLLVSSRPEVFNKGLTSRKINAVAYFELFENFQTTYFQPEKIGGLKYLSGYSPLINNTGEYLGFINLPYFTHQDKYSQEISTFVVAFINLYVLLFLASILVAIFIANQITHPLAAIRENLRKIELGKRNEPIHYGRNDEIGDLVKEYNKKVDELAVSAELLARSERETAWREMAKQIAHEIKNPLTPMKLNIQHLQRFKGPASEYPKYVERISQTLIEQIDTLSDIATEFSNFAKIPTARKQIFILSAQIRKVIELFENHDRVNIEFRPGDCGELMVNADREQLSRAFINLIKNAIQAIPDHREGHIVIAMMRKAHLVIVSVADNGTGIPDELKEKMFSPSFTTKSSGMGLGLAIVKNIVENFNGRIGFETRFNEGTTFYIEIPYYDEQQTIHDNSIEQ